MKTVRLLPEAEAELDEAIEWYDRQEYGVGARFLAAVGEGLDNIAEHPDRYPQCATLRDDSVLRRMLLTRFPLCHRLPCRIGGDCRRRSRSRRTAARLLARSYLRNMSDTDT